jgi:PadR family transcriptional regulator, regulatory protein AphA
MEYRIVETHGKRYIEGLPGPEKVAGEREALDMVSICVGNETNLLILHAENLTEDFFNLRTRVAGDILLKFSNYHIICALILTPELVGQGRFAEMAGEANRWNREFRVFYGVEEAERWLVNI